MHLRLDTAVCMTMTAPVPGTMPFLAHLGAELDFHETMTFGPENSLFLQVDVLQPLVSLV